MRYTIYQIPSINKGTPEDIYRKYPILAKEHLGISVDTEQIQDPLDFVRQYDASALAAPLNTNFLFREKEIGRLQKAFDENNVVIIFVLMFPKQLARSV